MADFNIKKGDTKPVISATLLDGNGAAVNLTGTTVKFRMRLHTAALGVLVVNATAVIDSPTAGTVHYQWVAPDTDLVGLYYGEWEVTYGGGAKQTLPGDDFNLIRVHDRL